ncbi:MAG TPA: hypothetical protein VFF06_32000 [Polyangia bacterium]|nr:hypothetical protein [Polyangia bacterium]
MAASRPIRCAAFALAALAAGCDAPTSLEVHVDVEPGFVPASQLAEVTIPSSGVTATQSLDPAARAFTVLLPDAALDVTVRVTAADASGLQRAGSLTATSIPHHRVDGTLCLGACGAPGDAASADQPLDAFSPSDSALDGAADLAGDLAPPPCSGPSKCAGAGTALCNGFESGTLDAPFSARIDTGGAAVFDSTRVCRGAKSLHLTTAAISSAQQIATYVFERQVVPTSTFYLRAFVWLPQQTASAAQSITFAFQTVSPFDSVEMHLQPNGDIQQEVSCGTFATSAVSAAPFPTDRWVCLEWEVVSAAGATGALHLSLDGQPLQSVDLTGAVTQPSPALDAVAIGLDVNATGAMSALDLWIDELAIDTQPIGCLK